MRMVEASRFRRGLLVVVGLLALESPSVATKETAPPQVSVHIVPTSSGANGGWIDLTNGKRFHVNVTNESKEPVRIWKEWCSWGYDNLSFEARDSKGSVTVISKRPGEWDKNFPCPVEIKPGGSWEIAVGFEPRIWQHTPVSGGPGKARVRLRAVYEIGEGKDSREMHVWTGRVSSPEAEYQISWN